MVRGLYTAYTGMLNEQNRLDIISNNLANSSTVGYKEENVTTQAFKDTLMYKIHDRTASYLDEAVGSMSLGAKIGETYTDWGQGSMRETGNTYDLGIAGNGFFAMRVTDKAGASSIMYTRNGNFTCTKDGYLTDSDGNVLQGSSGDIQVPTNASNIVIKTDGSIYADGTYVDTVKLTDFKDYNYLQQYGNNLYKAVSGATETTAAGQIQQGYTEQSNVNVVSEMVSMITITRAYEAGQKMIQTEDSLLDKAINQVGKV